MPFSPENCRNESEVESKLIVQYLLPVLGYSPDTWYQEVTFGSIRLDFLAFATQVVPFSFSDNSSSVVIEAKHPNQNLNNHVRRLKRYLTSLNVKYGLLTNGKEIRIYQQEQTQIKLLFKCLGKDIENNLDKINLLIGRESLIKNASAINSSQSINKNRDESIDQLEQEVIRLDQLYNVGLAAEGTYRMKTIAIYHNKGGVGKTTTVVNLAAAFSKRGKKILVIDLDSQANTTFATGLIKFDDIKDSNVRHVLQSEEAYPIKQVARSSQFNHPEIDVIPSHISLMRYEQELSQLADIKIMLDEKLQAVAREYDIAIFDTPPALNLFSEIALTTADYLIIPSDLKPFANQGLLNIKEFFKRIDKFRRIISKPPINVLGVLPCKISTNSKFVQSTLPKRIAIIPKRYGFEVMESIIYEREDLAKSVEKTISVEDVEKAEPKSVFDYKPDSTSAQEFEVLATEVLRKIGVTE